MFAGFTFGITFLKTTFSCILRDSNLKASLATSMSTNAWEIIKTRISVILLNSAETFGSLPS